MCFSSFSSGHVLITRSVVAAPGEPSLHRSACCSTSPDVGVGRDDEQAAHIERAAGIQIVEIEPLGTGVDFEDGACCLARRDDCLHVQISAVTRLPGIAGLEVESSGRMGEDIDVRVANGA